MGDRKSPNKSPITLMARQIGEGSFGGVYLTDHPKIVTKISTNTPYKSGSTEVNTAALKEMTFLRMADGKGVLGLSTCKIDAKYSSLKLKLYKGNIEGRIEEKLTFASFSKIIVKILEGVHRLHSMGIVHADLKPSNILYNSDEDIAIADLGISFFTNPSIKRLHDSIIQTRWWRAPEVARDRISGHEGEDGEILFKYSGKIDMWSLGIIFQSLAMGNPYPEIQDDDDEELLADYKVYYSQQRTFSKMSTAAFDGDEKKLGEFKVFLRSLLNLNEEKRFDITQALNSPFVHSINEEKVYPEINLINNWLDYSKEVKYPFHIPTFDELDVKVKLFSDQRYIYSDSFIHNLPRVSGSPISFFKTFIFYAIVANMGISNDAPGKDHDKFIRDASAVAENVSDILHPNGESEMFFTPEQLVMLNMFKGFFFYPSPGIILNEILAGTYIDEKQEFMVKCVNKVLTTHAQFISSPGTVAQAAFDIILGYHIRSIPTTLAPDMKEYKKAFEKIKILTDQMKVILQEEIEEKKRKEIEMGEEKEKDYDDDEKE